MLRRPVESTANLGRSVRRFDLDWSFFKRSAILKMMNGWQRLWVLVSSLWLLTTGSLFYLIAAADPWGAIRGLSAEIEVVTAQRDALMARVSRPNHPQDSASKFDLSTAKPEKPGFGMLKKKPQSEEKLWLVAVEPSEDAGFQLTRRE